MSFRRRGVAESGFIGARGARGRRDSDDYEDAYAPNASNGSGFVGTRNKNYGRNETGFEGLKGNQDDPNDMAPIGFNQDRDDPLNRSPDPVMEASRKKEVKPFKRVEKPLTHVDRDTVGKVIDLKDKYQKIKDRSKDKDKELKVYNMKIDALAERIKDIDKIKNGFKDQLFEEKKKNHLLKKKLDINEQEKLDLEQQLETGIKPTRKGKKGKGVFGNVDIDSHQQMLEEKRRKEREEMRRQLFVGIDFLGGGQLKVSQSNTTRCWTLIKNKIFNFFDTITPHKDDMKYISAKYDRAIQAFFQFYRFVVAFALIMFIFFILILVLHTAKYYSDNSFFSEPDWCNNLP